MNSFGVIFRVSLFGESHGEAIGVVVDGIPAGIPLTPLDFAADLARRRSGTTGTTKRQERISLNSLAVFMRDSPTAHP